MPFNPLQNYLQGQQAGQQQQVNTLQNSLAGQMQQSGFNPSSNLDFTRLSALDPQKAGAILNNFKSLSKERKIAYHEDLQDGLKALEAGDGNKFLNLMSARLNEIEKLKGDPAGTEFLLAKFNEGDIDGLITGLKATEQAGIDGGFLKDPLDRQIKEAQLEKLTSRERSIPAEQQAFEALIADFSPEDQKIARRVKAGLKGRAVSDALMTAIESGQVQTVADAKAVIKQSEKFAELTGASRANTIDKGVEKIATINTGIGNIDRAISLINSGAGVGAIERFLPSFKATSVELDNVQKSMALDVIGAVTFGALSKGELDLAREIALPTGLDGPQLVDHLNRRKAAQEKLRDYYGEQIQFLDQGGSVAGFLKQKKGSRSQPSQNPTQQLSDDEMLKKYGGGQ